MFPRAIWKASKRRLRFQLIFIGYWVFIDIYFLAVRRYGWSALFTVFLVMAILERRKTKRIYLETRSRRALREQLNVLAQHICGREQEWSVQTDRGLIGIFRPGRRKVNVFRISPESLDEDYNTLDHSVQAVTEAFVITPRYADVLRVVGVCRFEEAEPGTAKVTDDVMRVAIRPSELRNELIIATEDELRSILSDLEYARTYEI